MLHNAAPWWLPNTWWTRHGQLVWCYMECIPEHPTSMDISQACASHILDPSVACYICAELGLGVEVRPDPNLWDLDCLGEKRSAIRKLRLHDIPRAWMQCMQVTHQTYLYLCSGGRISARRMSHCFFHSRSVTSRQGKHTRGGGESCILAKSQGLIRWHVRGRRESTGRFRGSLNQRSQTK